MTPRRVESSPKSTSAHIKPSASWLANMLTELRRTVSVNNSVLSGCRKVGYKPFSQTNGRLSVPFKASFEGDRCPVGYSTAAIISDCFCDAEGGA